ncbi:hypothetical protein ACIQRS_31195 [Streptomyces termitum]|uniref:Uncharacterized protein n=1 Tax=Streptomyces termitum TaxID=67368 RepID=A0A918TDD8_9ACTN|nr:hypothetical protein GCM10010305_62870 [Streptomyces termitum]
MTRATEKWTGGRRTDGGPYDAVVVGAGAAGLARAADLSAAGLPPGVLPDRRPRRHPVGPGRAPRGRR